MDAHFQNDRLMQDADAESHATGETRSPVQPDNDLHNGGLKEVVRKKRVVSKKCHAGVAVFVFLMLAATTGGLVFLFTHVTHGRRLPEVTTTVGVLRGRVVQAPQGSEVNEYLGIPFARPPVGDLRYHDPVRLDRLPSDPYDATDHKYSCIQFLDTTFGSFAGSAMWNAPNILREDCLYMNVWTPRSPGKKAVMVWIYGGGFYSGSNALWVYDGKALAAYGDVIVVAPNYRVGTFGYLSTGDGKIKGNFGMLDQVMALEWVRDNIATFGGDPDRVTLFGESSGASSAGLHLMSARSRPLFRRTIFESGSPDSHWSFMTSAQARHRSRTFLGNVNCLQDDDAGAMLRCLRALPVDVIQREEWVDSHFMVFPWAPTVDGRFLTDTPYNLLKAGQFQRKESILGVNKDEGTYWILYVLAGFTKDGPSLQNRTTFRDGIDVMAWDLSKETRTRLKKLYRPTDDSDRTAFRDALGDMCGDRSFTCPTWEMASTLADAGAPTYFYYLAYRTTTEVWPPWMGVIHGAEIQWVFGMAMNSSKGYTREEVKFSQTIMSYWANFAKNGNPNGNSEPEWLPFTTKKSHYLRMNGGDHFEVKTNLRTKYCKLWAEIGQKINMQIQVK